MQIIRIVNMIPFSSSGETSQDSQPDLTVNPADPDLIVGAAYTPGPAGGDLAPLYVSTDRGATWALNPIVPGNGPHGAGPDGGISVTFASTGGNLYAAVINGDDGDSYVMQILHTADVTGPDPMTPLLTRGAVEEPWAVAITTPLQIVSRESADELPGWPGTRALTDRLFVGSYYFGGTQSIVDVSGNAASADAAFASVVVEDGVDGDGDLPLVPVAVHPDGTVYAAFERFELGNLNIYQFAVVVTRDDFWGESDAPFQALGADGSIVAPHRTMVGGARMGQQALIVDLAITVDPADSRIVWVAWCDMGTGTDFDASAWTLHLRRSTDGGASWWDWDIRTIDHAKNPAIAANESGELGLLYQAFTGSSWLTQLEIVTNPWPEPSSAIVLHQAPADVPDSQFDPYLGDHIRLLAIGTAFYGIFCGNNTPDQANFPHGVTYQRAADWATGTLLDTDGTTEVTPSIDPFFFEYRSERLFPPAPTEPPIIGYR
jgi:hypothetical protein